MPVFIDGLALVDWAWAWQIQRLLYLPLQVILFQIILQPKTYIYQYKY